MVIYFDKVFIFLEVCFILLTEKFEETSITLSNNNISAKINELINIASIDNRRLTESIERWSTNFIASTESEKYRVSKDLHDGICQILYAAKLILQGFLHELSPQKDKSTYNKIIQVQRIIDDAINEIRSVSKFLAPPTYKQISIISEINTIVYEFSKRLDLKCLFTTNEFYKQFDSHIEVCLFRIVEEALLNIEMHAMANSLEVSIISIENMVELKIVDDGIGFDTNIIKEKQIYQSSSGLTSMLERVNIVGGICIINSGPGKGTNINVTIPLNKNGH